MLLGLDIFRFVLFTGTDYTTFDNGTVLQTYCVWVLCSFVAHSGLKQIVYLESRLPIFLFGSAINGLLPWTIKRGRNLSFGL